MSIISAENGYLGWREARDYAGLSVSTLRRLIAEGKLRAYRPTQVRTLIAREDIDRYMESTRITAEA